MGRSLRSAMWVVQAVWRWSRCWAAPATAQTWVSAWGGRGPLSTTITTNHTFTDPAPNLSGRTLRVMAHLTTGGSQVRVRLSQRFGSSPLSVGAAHVAIRGLGQRHRRGNRPGAHVQRRLQRHRARRRGRLERSDRARP